MICSFDFCIFIKVQSLRTRLLHGQAACGIPFPIRSRPLRAFRRSVFSRNLFLHAASSDLAWSRSNAQSHNNFSCIFPERPRLPVICSPAATVWIFDLTFLYFPYPVWYRIFLCPSIRQKAAGYGCGAVQRTISSRCRRIQTGFSTLRGATISLRRRPGDDIIIPSIIPGRLVSRPRSEGHGWLTSLPQTKGFCCL